MKTTEVKTTSTNPPPFNTDEMVQKIRSDFKEEMMNTLRQFQDAHPAPTLPTPPTPTIPPQPLLVPPGAPQPSNIPQSPVPHRCSRSPHTRNHHREDTVLCLDKGPVFNHRSLPRRRAKSTHDSMRGQFTTRQLSQVTLPDENIYTTQTTLE